MIRAVAVVVAVEVEVEVPEEFHMICLEFPT